MKKLKLIITALLGRYKIEGKIIDGKVLLGITVSLTEFLKTMGTKMPIRVVASSSDGAKKLNFVNGGLMRERTSMYVMLNMGKGAPLEEVLKSDDDWSKPIVAGGSIISIGDDKYVPVVGKNYGHLSIFFVNMEEPVLPYRYAFLEIY